MELNADLARLCFEYLDAWSLCLCEAVSHEWQTTARDCLVWERLYCSLWRDGEPLPSDSRFKALGVVDWKMIYIQRSSVSLEMSARGTQLVRPDGTVSVVSSASRFQYSVDSICSQAPMEPLAISRLASASYATPQSGICYFEARFLGCGSIGFTSHPEYYPRTNYGAGRRHHVGWYPISYGYHSDDGRVFWNDGATVAEGQHQAYGPSWGKTEETPQGTEPDTIGSGIDLLSGDIFFTKNGVFVGYSPIRAHTGRDYMAAVSLHDYGNAVDINMGRKAFVFDIESFIALDEAQSSDIE